MKKLFWFSKIGTKDSFSRIGEAILPILKNDYDYKLYTIINKNFNIKEDVLDIFDEIITMGDDINEGDLKLNEKEYSSYMNRNIGSDMNYSLLQGLAKCREKKIKNFFITMGVYENNFFMKTIESIRNSYYSYLLDDIYIILYLPIDYIPSEESVKYIIKSDKIITTVPYMVNILKKLNAPVINWVEHGLDERFKRFPVEKRSKLLEILNSVTNIWNGKCSIKENDIIILNANLYYERKRIESTIKAFNEVSKKMIGYNLKLWLHGCGTEKMINLVDNKNLLITSKKLSNSELNLVYNICQIGLQTSWGEGWSLTNCEHGMLGGLQVVPDWLACGYHFRDGRGILIPVDKQLAYNEEKCEVILGIPDQKQVEDKLCEAVKMISEQKYNPEKTIEYLKQYTWKSACKKIDDVIEL